MLIQRCIEVRIWLKIILTVINKILDFVVTNRCWCVIIIMWWHIFLKMLGFTFRGFQRAKCCCTARTGSTTARTRRATLDLRENQNNWLKSNSKLSLIIEDYNLVLNDFEIKSSPFLQPSRGGSSFGGSARRSPSCAETLASGDQLKRGFVGDALRFGDEDRRWGCEGGGDIGRPVDGSPPLFSKGPPPLRTCATLVMRKL